MPATESDPNSQPPAAPRELTSDEAALYDRQIRLWGLEAQRKLASSSVLLVGAVCSLEAQEVAKNVVLAGVARLGLVEYEHSGLESARNFLGSSVEGIIQSLTEMNPHVQVQVVEKPCFEAVQQFSVVCAFGLARKQEMAFADACRAVNVPFMCGRACGVVGWVFFDLGAHYGYQKTKSSAADAENSSSVSTYKVSFCSYKQAVEHLWGGESKRSAFGWHVACSMQEFEARHKRIPSGSEEDVKLMAEVYTELCASKKSRMSNDQLVSRAAKTAACVLGPVSAIVGGMWGREVVKVVSGKGEPLKNFFFFNADNNVGSVEHVGPL
ncbi:ubiquitin-activating enzyme [Gracilaria domingensis]|nr:ubiquitin-activating enzyme [Gracilaria domingensis]